MKEIAIRNLSELELAGSRLISSDDVPRVTMRKHVIDEATDEYQLEGNFLLNRETINTLLRMPMDEPGENWHDAYDGLRDIANGHRRIRRVGRQAGLADHLHDIRRPVRELADVMKRNVHETVITANVPVFRYGQTHRYIFDSLKTYDSRKLLNLLKGFDFDPSLAQRMLKYIASSESERDLRGFEQLEVEQGLDRLEQEIVNAAIIGESDDRTLIELVHYLQQKGFIGFRERNAYRDDHLVGGAKEFGAFFLNETVPGGVTLDDSEVFIGPQLPDNDRKTGLPRYHTEFISNYDAVYARPLLVWRRTAQGRQFVFPSQKFDVPTYDSQGEITSGPPKRANSIAGAAIAAAVLGQDINYAGALDAALKKAAVENSTIARAGLLPLVIRYRQDDLLSMPYFKKVEERIDKGVQ